MPKTQRCLSIDCEKSYATYEKPLCYQHWRLYQSGDYQQCRICHWVFGGEELIFYELTELRDRVKAVGEDVDEFMCEMCMVQILKDAGKWQLPNDPQAAESIVKRLSVPRESAPHFKPFEREMIYVYVLKKNDGNFYIGQSKDLKLRLQEHRDGKVIQTKNKDPRLVYFVTVEGDRDEANLLEDTLTRLALHPAGQRKIRKVVEQFRERYRLVDWNT